jgi:DNA-binding response OmpR family regulator
MPRILVIDDEAHIRHMMRLTLEAAGYEVGDAADGLRGLEMCGTDAVWDVVLLDQKMPGIDGMETLRRLRARAPATRVIMVTAFASIELAVEAMKLGATDFVRKPMTPDILRQTVAAALAKPPVATPMGRPGSAARPQRPRIETVTMNGFHLVRTSAEERTTAAHPGVYHFLVRDPTGQEHDVVVQVDASAVAMVERVIRRPLPLTSSFWQSYAEHTLATYVWDEGRIPSLPLTITQVERRDVDLAARWEETVQ